jgi:hypothetical protein
MLRSIPNLIMNVGDLCSLIAVMAASGANSLPEEERSEPALIAVKRIPSEEMRVQHEVVKRCTIASIYVGVVPLRGVTYIVANHPHVFPKGVIGVTTESSCEDLEFGLEIYQVFAGPVSG